MQNGSNDDTTQLNNHDEEDEEEVFYFDICDINTYIYYRQKTKHIKQHFDVTNDNQTRCISGVVYTHNQRYVHNVYMMCT